MSTLPAKDHIAVLGLGNVGLPLPLAVARAGFDLIGLDIHSATVDAMHAGRDPNAKVADAAVVNSDARFTCDAADLTGRTAFKPSQHRNPVPMTPSSWRPDTANLPSRVATQFAPWASRVWCSMTSRVCLVSRAAI